MHKVHESLWVIGHMMSHDTHMIGIGQVSDKLKVLCAVDVPVPHELEVVLIDLVLDDSWHRVHEEVSTLPFLDQSLGEGGREEGREGGRDGGEREGRRDGGEREGRREGERDGRGREGEKKGGVGGRERGEEGESEGQMIAHASPLT